ncbi:GNAT family N-acetyltransferase [Clostridium sp. D2Q-11]|uniref:GNAT family N-acetyltransferase n=1 Tax=Anaeromonas frigoriresistens TaxID=2683708 RepID=A0A942Z7H0_9FIRM|nr:GNAT family N-acetyltransferase [Anaeromonas frigoriresistens]MBS4538687.1 GNAT family N-acetyltransferase [Anaeromonas frigoriresistens]
MIIREYRSSDLNSMLKLFYDTVHEINIKDYSREQVNVWAPKLLEKEKWKGFFEDNFTYVAIIEDRIVGFSDLTNEGYLNTMYVHKDYQSKGVGTRLLDRIEKEAHGLGIIKLITEASITSRPFFQKRGFAIVKKQNKKHKDEVFINYIMEKSI